MAIIQDGTVKNNWGRWGEDDQVGAVNLISAHKTIMAARLVSSGRIVSLSRGIPTEPGSGNPRPAQHFVRRSALSGSGGAALDYLMIGWHGYTCTHLDGLCHVWGPEGMWNGRKPEEEITFEGAKWGGIEHWTQGIVTRGVLLDIPAHRKTPCVTVENPVTACELRAVAEDSGVEVSAGDAVVVYCGRGAWDATYGGGSHWEAEAKKPGLDASCLEFFRERDCSMVVWDMLDATVVDSFGKWGVHAGIYELGLALLDNAELEGLVLACQEELRREFMLVVAPLRLIGGTGSPVNPLALF